MSPLERRSVDVSRRSFLRGALAVIAMPAVVKITSLMPVRGLIVPWIRGDGIYNDTAGLQAALSGKPFLSDVASVIGRCLYLGKGAFRITETLQAGSSRDFRGTYTDGWHTRLVLDHGGHGLRMGIECSFKDLSIERMHESAAAFMDLGDFTKGA